MTYADALERYMLTLVNEERTSRGLNPLQLETNLNSSAEEHSLWMLETNTFSHTGVGGSTSTERIIASGFDYVGTRGTSENIAAQTTRGADGFYDDVATLHEALMNSSGHRDNILNPNRDYIGIGIEIGNYTYDGGLTRESVMITQNFGRTAGTVDLDDLNGGLTVTAVQADTTATDQSAGVLHQGSAADETLQGAASDDTLYGGSGADTFNGGAGRDAVSYAGSFGSLLVDLQFSHVNTFAASGDTYDSIEDLIGSQGADNLRGNQEANLISGEGNVDYIFGRREKEVVADFRTSC